MENFGFQRGFFHEPCGLLDFSGATLFCIEMISVTESITTRLYFLGRVLSPFLCILSQSNPVITLDLEFGTNVNIPKLHLHPDLFSQSQTLMFTSLLDIFTQMSHTHLSFSQSRMEASLFTLKTIAPISPVSPGIYSPIQNIPNAHCMPVNVLFAGDTTVDLTKQSQLPVPSPQRLILQICTVPYKATSRRGLLRT